MWTNLTAKNPWSPKLVWALLPEAPPGSHCEGSGQKSPCVNQVKGKVTIFKHTQGECNHFESQEHYVLFNKGMNPEKLPYQTLIFPGGRARRQGQLLQPSSLLSSLICSCRLSTPSFRPLNTFIIVLLNSLTIPKSLS